MHPSGRPRILLVILTVAAATLFGATPVARAQQLPTAGSMEVTPFLGFTFGSDQEGPSLTLGGAFAYNYTPQIAFEGEIGILPDLEGDTDAVDLRVTTFSGNLVYHFDTGSPYVPYGTIGLGFARQNLEIRGLDDASTELGVNIGGGVKTEVGDGVTLRGDVRYFNLNDETPNFWRLYGGMVFTSRR